MDRLRLKYGLHWSGRYPPLARPLFAVFVALLLGVLFLVADGYKAQAEEYERVKPIYQSYLAVVLAAMNGDAKFQVGELLFECRGGRL